MNNRKIVKGWFSRKDEFSFLDNWKYRGPNKSPVRRPGVLVFDWERKVVEGFDWGMEEMVNGCWGWLTVVVLVVVRLLV